MSSNNRAALIGKLHTALKKHYQPISTGSRPLLEHVLYASLLQDAPYEMADEGIAKCEQEFFDWNEVRVTTVTELSQVLSHHPDPVKAAGRLKGNLQDIFEEFYSFDIDIMRKENLGKAVAKFENMPNMTPFVLSYTVQNGLGGHSIPVDYAGFVVMLSTGIISQSEAADSRVPGLERAIPKTKGIEFGSLLHQCGVALMVDPKDKTARTVLDAVDKGSSGRLDSWLNEKEMAIERVRQRKTDERETARVEAENADEEEPVVAKGKASKAKAAAKASTPKAPKKPIQKLSPKATGKSDAAVKKPSTPTKPKTNGKVSVKGSAKSKPTSEKKPAEENQPTTATKPTESKLDSKAAAESNGTVSDPKGTVSDPKGTGSDPKGTGSDPKGTGSDSKGGKSGKATKTAKTPKKPITKKIDETTKTDAKSVKIAKSSKATKSAAKSDTPAATESGTADNVGESNPEATPQKSQKPSKKKTVAKSDNRKLTKKKPR